MNCDLAEKRLVHSTFNFSAKCATWCSGSCWFNCVPRIPVSPVGRRIISGLCACHVQVLKICPRSTDFCWSNSRIDEAFVSI